MIAPCNAGAGGGDYWPARLRQVGVLAAVIPAIERAGRSTLLVELHDGQRRLPFDLSRDRRLVPTTVVVVDGYEQLSCWSLARLKRVCRSHGLGLLVTAHASAGLPPVAETASSLDLAEPIVARLTAHGSVPLDAASIGLCYVRHDGNLREMLFDLYDLAEQHFLSAGKK